jgi:hypothetical protein
LHLTILGSDIDIICFYPHLQEFIYTFVDGLANHFIELSSFRPIKHVLHIKTSRVPIFTLQYDDVLINLSFYALPLKMMRLDEDIVDENVVKDLLFEDGSRSLNSYRVTETLKDQVPAQKPFADALTWIKVWAKRRAILGGVYGYFPSHALALLLIRVHMQYPEAEAIDLFRLFFWTYAFYDWNAPITVHVPFYTPEFCQETGDTITLAPYHFHPYLNSLNTQEMMAAIAPMKIMSLTRPTSSVTDLVRKPALRVIEHELQRAYYYLQSIEPGMPKDQIAQHLENVFQSSNFFTRYGRYILFSIAVPDSFSKKADDCIVLLQKFAGFTQSRLRVRVARLENDYASNSKRGPPIQIDLFPEPLYHTVRAYGVNSLHEMISANDPKKGIHDEDAKSHYPVYRLAFFVAGVTPAMTDRTYSLPVLQDRYRKLQQYLSSDMADLAKRRRSTNYNEEALAQLVKNIRTDYNYYSSIWPTENSQIEPKLLEGAIVHAAYLSFLPRDLYNL